jgi:sialate O-acetylesterase
VPGNTTPDQVVWKVSDAATSGAFSAVCYYFGRELSERLNVPIGLIQSTKSGTPIEQWAHVSGPRSGVLYESKIKPLMPYAIRGFAWYQGEDNSKDSTDVYLAKLRALILEWRTAWDQDQVNFPFGIVQLPFGRKPPTQEAQLQAFLTIPQTFLAVTSDLPDLGGTAGHPANKRPVGLRLAIGAGAIVYGDGTEPVGPIRDPAASYVSGGTVVIGFTHVGGRLVTGSEWQPAGDPAPFRVAGSDGRFYAATAKIVGNSVQVSSPSVLTPVSVRYTDTYGMGNLYSDVSIPIQGGARTYTRLPASPFALTFGP